MLWHFLTSFFYLSLLLKSLFFFFVYGHNAKCTNQDRNWVYTGTILWHKGWYDTNMIWYVCNGSCRPLMCTSNVAGNTPMASLDRQVTQNGLGFINAMASGIYNGGIPRYQDDMEVTVRVDDEWRWSWWRYQKDGDSSLSSRNTLGNGKTVNSKSQMSNGGSGNAVLVAEAQWDCGNGNYGLWSTQWGIRESGGGLYTVSELEAWSLSRRNTLGDTTHNTSKIGLSWVGGSVCWSSLCGSGGGGWWGSNRP